MILKWVLRHWLDIITAVGILYGIGMSTYNFLDSRKTKKRQLKVKLLFGFIPVGGDPGETMLLLKVMNPGDRTVTVNSPYIILPDGKFLITPWPLSHVRFPYDLEEGKNCVTWMKEAEVREHLLKMGYTGKVELRGAVDDATDTTYRSKQTCTFDLEKKQ